MNTAPRRRRAARSIASSLVAAMVAIAASSTTAALAQTPYDEAVTLLEKRRPDDLAASLRLFGQAARSDPSDARAQVGIATAASLLALYSAAPPRPLFATARAAAAEALRLDPELATAHAVMGLVEYLDRRDFAAAESRFEQALDLDRTAATTWHWYGMLMLATSRFDASLVAYDRAITFARSELFLIKRASVLAAAGRGEAERELRQVVRRFPESSMAKRELGYLLIAGGRGEDGLVALREAAELSGAVEDNAELGWGYARTGHRKEAEAIAARVTRSARAAVKQARAAGSAPAAPPPEKRSSAAPGFVSPIEPALVYAGLDRPDDAFEWLEMAREIHDPGLVYLAVAPGFAPLRDDPRFAPLLSAIGLDAAVAAEARDREARAREDALRAHEDAVREREALEDAAASGRERNRRRRDRGDRELAPAERAPEANEGGADAEDTPDAGEADAGDQAETPR